MQLYYMTLLTVVIKITDGFLNYLLKFTRKSSFLH